MKLIDKSEPHCRVIVQSFDGKKYLAQKSFWVGETTPEDLMRFLKEKVREG